MPRRTDCSLSRSTLPMFRLRVAWPLDLTRLPRHHGQPTLFPRKNPEWADGRRWHRPFWGGRATRGRRVAVHLLSATVSAHQPHRVFGRLRRTPPHGGHLSVTFPNPLSRWVHRPLRLDLSTRRPTAIVGNYAPSPGVVFRSRLHRISEVLFTHGDAHRTVGHSGRRPPAKSVRPSDRSYPLGDTCR
jgi:hypothetical protein